MVEKSKQSREDLAGSTFVAVEEREEGGGEGQARRSDAFELRKENFENSRWSFGRVGSWQGSMISRQLIVSVVIL